MELGRKVAAFILVILLVIPLAMAALLVLSISPWAMNRNFYLELLDDERLYALILQEESMDFYVGQILPVLEGVPPKGLSRALREVVAPAYLRSETVRLVNEGFDALEGRVPSVNPYWDLRPLKTELLGGGGRRFAEVIASTLPACSSGQEPLASGAAILRCRPEGLSEKQAADGIAVALPELISQIPDRFEFIPAEVYFSFESGWGGSWPGMRTSSLVVAGIVLAIFAGCLWVAAAFLGGSDRRERTLWMGLSLIIPAAFVLLIGVMIKLALVREWGYFGLRSLIMEAFAYNQELVLALLDKIRLTINTVARGFLSVGAVSSGIALGFIVWGFSIEPKETTRQ